MNWHAFFFYVYATMACGFALAVVFTSNVVRMAFYLTLCLGATSGLFYLAGADFVGAMQLLIYVGGTLVLLIFGVMLTAQEPFISIQTDSGEWMKSSLVGGALLIVLLAAAVRMPQWLPPATAAVEAQAELTPTSTPLGLELLSTYLLPFEIVSMHLLVVLVGAAYLARTKKRASRSAAEQME
ncbi:MAG: NADH-quinone oxidoreductase subunit J [Pirellulales bacterium]|nr:NADH-quinone oxidoreductase subunit J [Pirellulales bacterium]